MATCGTGGSSGVGAPLPTLAATSAPAATVRNAARRMGAARILIGAAVGWKATASRPFGGHLPPHCCDARAGGHPGGPTLGLSAVAQVRFRLCRARSTLLGVVLARLRATACRANPRAPGSSRKGSGSTRPVLPCMAKHGGEAQARSYWLE